MSQQKGLIILLKKYNWSQKKDSLNTIALLHFEIKDISIKKHFLQYSINHINKIKTITLNTKMTIIKTSTLNNIYFIDSKKAFTYRPNIIKH